MIFFFLLLFGELAARSIRERYFLDVDSLRELDAWELRLLRDFVRRKGKGSVSKLSIDDILNEQEGYGLNDKNVVPVKDPLSRTRQLSSGGSSFIIPMSIIAPSNYISPFQTSLGRRPALLTRGVADERPIPTTISQDRLPTNISKWKMEKRSELFQNKNQTEEPSKEMFKELAGIFQKFIDRRKPMVDGSHSTVTTSAHHATKTSFGRSILTPSTSAIGQWEPMNPNSEVNDEELILKPTPRESTKEEWEQKMKDLSEQLSNILKQIKRTKKTKPQDVTKFVPKTRPKLTILRNGSAEQTDDGRYDFVATMTLIQDDGKNILVDTGLGTDINGRTNMITALSRQGLAPPSIHIVVTTHGHPDHSGGIHDFPDALHYQGWFVHQSTFFNLNALFEGERQMLTSNVYLIKSGGHTSDDIAVVVMNEETLGTVIVAGDTFVRQEDIDYPMMWQPLSVNETLQTQSRKTIACGAQWVVPGHGQPFIVTIDIKKKIGC